ncbi:MAG: HAD hydrolase family protein [Actinomycetota bacterium]
MTDNLAIVYSDLDGTLLGPGGSLFSTSSGETSLRAAAAIKRLHDAGVRLVLISGRTQLQMQEAARMTGASAYIAELGALIIERDGYGPEATTRAFGTFEGAGAPVEEMARSGAAAYLLDRYAGALEPHTPWSEHHREATMLFRGHVPNGNEALRAGGYGWLRLLDNGILPRAFPGLGVDEVHAYHLVPEGVSKATGLRIHLQRSGADATQAVAIGDSLSDLELATEVGRMFIVANGRAGVGDAIERFTNAAYTQASHGDGFAEAIDQLLD